jgi:small subunit ribosomal protein S20
MADHYSALKRARQSEAKTAVNRSRKSRLRHEIRALRRKLDENDAEGAETLLPKAFSVIDRAAKWGIIKANTAARYKSRLHSRLKALAEA